MIGIVIVSHSKKLAEGVLELAAQMTRGVVPMAAVGGIDDPDNPFGADPMQVLAAVESVAARADGGVLVVMDLGSALMSAETALDFLPEAVKAKVLLCAAPLVEGTIAAAAQASVGASLQEAGDEAGAALAAKIEQLAPAIGQNPGRVAAAAQVAPAPQEAPEGETLRLELRIANKLGLHARPAARLVSTVGKFQATVAVQRGDKSASAKSINQIALLGVKYGDLVVVTISGPDAKDAANALQALYKDNFGDRDEDVAAVGMETQSCEAVGEGVVVGTPASAGYAAGPAQALLAALPEVKRREAADPAAEVVKLDQAIAAALADVNALRRETQRKSGAANAAIFEVHGLILSDKVLRDQAVARIVAEKSNAAFAWLQVMEQMAANYRALEDAFMQARATDVLDCGRRVLRLLTGEGGEAVRLARQSILVADDLSPSDVAGLDPGMVLGIVVETGGATSHAAILARAMGIPAVIGVGDCLRQVSDGQMIALDGFAGTVWTTPGEAVLDDIAAKRAGWLAGREAAKAKGAAPARTRDGAAITVMGNIGLPAEAARALEYGAEGVGLFRTEFLFLDRDQAPDEEEQFAAYCAAAQAMQGNPVIIRTLDVGGDKPIRYLDAPHEANPFLGERGVRFCMARPELFRIQLRALLRAAGVANIRIMYPMISDGQELAGVLAFAARVRAELAAEGRQIADKTPTGVMIEVPSAAAVADQLAGLCDFFSIGTNDLTQYVMACDRGNAAVAARCDSLNPAVLRLIAMTCDAAKAAGIPVGLCGELAGDHHAAPLLLGLGLDELSMSGPAIAAVKEAIRSVDMADCRALAREALAAGSADAVRALLLRSTAV